MQERQSGITALITAYARVYHAAQDAALIFDDSLAVQLFTGQEQAEFARNLTGLIHLVDPEYAAKELDPAARLARVMQVQSGPITLSRSRYTEDCLAEAIRQGISQYVILGAGLDTFAFRHPDLAQKLEVFEVDHPATQALKRERIDKAGWQIPPNLHFVALDFTEESLQEKLAQSAYDPRKASFFSWLGVSYYLTPAVILGTLRAFAVLAAQGSSIVFDYLDQDAFDPQKASARVQRMQWIVRQAGEPMKSWFDPQLMEDALAEIGLRVAECLTPETIDARYFAGRADRYCAFEHIHFLRLEKYC